MPVSPDDHRNRVRELWRRYREMTLTCDECGRDLAGCGAHVDEDRNVFCRDCHGDED